MPSLYPDAVNPESIRRFTFLLADAAQDADPTTPIPTCGDWTLDDLMAHLTEVQDFWTFVIATRPNPPKNYEKPARASGRRLTAGLKNAATGLAAVLADAPANDSAWSWAPEQTVGFSIRRQTHEALMHCIDGLLALDLPLPQVSAELAADGIDEIVHVMLEPVVDTPSADTHDTGTVGPEPTGTVLLHATDTNDRWTIAIGEGGCTISGKALDLNLWLWGRARSWPLTFTGSTDQAAVLRAKIAGDTRQCTEPIVITPRGDHN